MRALLGMRFDEYDGTLLWVENPALLETLVETGSLSRRCVPGAAAEGHVLVGLDSDATDFLFEDESPAFEAFLRHAYLATAEHSRLILSDVRPLYDLLSQSLLEVLERVPAVTLNKALRGYHGYPLHYLQYPFSRNDAGVRALERGRPFSGMFGVCPYDGESGCYSTYAWIEEQVCLSMAVHHSDLSLWLFPFRVTG